MRRATAQAAIGGRSRDGIAQRLAADLRDGYVVNLGVGIPLLIPRYIPPDVEVILHAENGVLGLGPLAAPSHEDPDLTDAGKQPATLITGAAIVDSAMSFAVVRGGHLDVTVLGALQVSARGAGQPKIVGRCTFPLTGRAVVTRVYTDLAVFHIVDGELRLTEYAPGVTPAAVRERTGAPYAEDLHPEG
jgi:acyl CoA:acetate/3-ketoacid CoA transferase beta subunit